jgi:hypothetical protein
MDVDERLRLDYEQTTELYRELVDERFKLLALVPTLSGAAVGLLGAPRSASELLGLGLLGLVATLGVFFYELRNMEILEGVVDRARKLEERLGLASTIGGAGLFSERVRRSTRLLGLITVIHDRALALVYGAALAGWSYLVAWGALRALDVGGARKVGGLIGVVAGLLVIAEVERIGRRDDRAGRPSEQSA